MLIHRRTVLASALALLPACRTASAQASYPDKPIRLIVPFAPGGNADLTGRLFAEALAKRLGQPVVVENRGGAGGAIGSEQLAKAAPDGYTLGLGSTGTYLVSPRMTGGTPPYTLASFAPVALLNTSSMVIEVNAQNPIKDWAGFLGYVRANPGKLTIGPPGNGSTNHLALLRPTCCPARSTRRSTRSRPRSAISAAASCFPSSSPARAALRSFRIHRPCNSRASASSMPPRRSS